MVDPERRPAPAPPAPTTGSVRSRAYIIAREPTSAPQIWVCGWRADPRGSVATAAESIKDVFDIYTIIFLALAVFIFLRLRSVLGQRTGRERPPYDPYSARDAVRPSTNDNVVALPGRSSDAPPLATEPAEPAWKGVAEEGSSVAAGLEAIAKADKGFDAQRFVTGARAA